MWKHNLYPGRDISNSYRERLSRNNPKLDIAKPISWRMLNVSLYFIVKAMPFLVLYYIRAATHW